MRTMTKDERDTLLTISMLPGITVREIRAAAGLEPLGVPEVDDLMLNLPIQDEA